MVDRSVYTRFAEEGRGIFRCKSKGKDAIRTYTYYFVKPEMTKLSHFSQAGNELPTNENLAIDDPRRRRLPPLLRKAWLKLNAVFLRRLSDVGLTPDQYIVLRWLEEKGNPGLTQREISDWMASDPNTIASLVKRMEAAGLIRRRPRAKDLRVKEVLPTKTGRRLFTKAKSRAQALEKAALHALSPAEQKVFLASLKKVASACRRSSNGPALD